MSPNSCIPINARQLKASVRINEMFFNQLRPVVHISSIGTLESFQPWKSTAYSQTRPANWLQLQKQTDVLMAEVDKCVETNPDYYVSLAGYSEDEVVECMYLMHSPSRLYGTSCSIPTVPFVDSKEFPDNVDKSSS